MSSAPEKASFPLFYKNPVPLDAQKHAEIGLKEDFGLEFAAKINAVPINLIEMPQICHTYPIAFSPDENATPVAIVGLRDNENLFLTDNNQWMHNVYIPAYVRRYPFIFSEIPESDQLTLCVDFDPSVINEQGGQKFFEGDGQPSSLAKNALEFCKSYHAAARQTIEFSKALQDSGILVARNAEITTPTGAKINFSGFRIIDEKKFADMDEKTFLEWRRKGWLPFIYAHLFSGIQWQTLTRLLNDKLKN